MVIDVTCPRVRLRSYFCDGLFGLPQYSSHCLYPDDLIRLSGVPSVEAQIKLLLSNRVEAKDLRTSPAKAQ